MTPSPVDAAPQPIGGVMESRTAPANALASHTATYKISLVRARQQEGMRGAAGRMTYSIVERCDGYTAESGLEAQFSFANGLTSSVQQSYAGWESKDGRHATFRMRTIENGEVTDNYDGQADLEEDGSGTVEYRGPNPAKYDLPPGTLLSSAQLIEILASAQRGENLFVHSVMDGAFTEGPHKVSGVIGPARAVNEASSTVDASMSHPNESRVWPITMAYFLLNELSETPSYELSVLVHDDGVVASMTQDFGTYTLEFDPVSIEYLDKDPC
ncbi:MAG: DUF1849 family protein [Rhodobacteraceae bacterium]|nr:DUF1849 family protein [Paracoccaceae bacterium]